MTPIEATDHDLAATREHWLRAIRTEDRSVEAACMSRINRLLDKRAELTRHPAIETP